MSLDSYDTPNLSGIPSDYLPVTPDDYADNTGDACIGLYVETAGNVNSRLVGTPGADPVEAIKASVALIASDGTGNAVPALRLYHEDTGSAGNGFTVALDLQDGAGTDAASLSSGETVTITLYADNGHTVGDLRTFLSGLSTSEIAALDLTAVAADQELESDTAAADTLEAGTFVMSGGVDGVTGESVVLPVTAGAFIPGRFTRVLAGVNGGTGVASETTATGIFALQG